MVTPHTETPVLDWDSRTCLDPECGKQHLILFDRETDEIIGAVNGPSALGEWEVVYKGDFVSEFRSSDKAMKGLLDHHARECAQIGPNGRRRIFDPQEFTAMMADLWKQIAPAPIAIPAITAPPIDAEFVPPVRSDVSVQRYSEVEEWLVLGHLLHRVWRFEIVGYPDGPKPMVHFYFVGSGSVSIAGAAHVEAAIKYLRSQGFIVPAANPAGS